MKTFGWLILFAIYTSPLTFILSGCQWKPDAPGTVNHVKTSDWLTPKVTPVVAPAKSPLCKCTNCDCKDCDCGTIEQRPNTPVAPVPDGNPDKYAPPKFPPVTRTPAPLTAEQRAELNCADGSCSVESYESQPRRGLFRRWRN